jgi:hypothetical protein
MDTQDKFPPRDAEDQINRDADFNPEAIAANPGLGEDGLPGGYDDEGMDADAPKPVMTRWRTIGLIAGGVAVAAGIAGMAYWRMRQTPKPQGLLDRFGAPKIDLSQAHPRRLSHMAGRRIEQLPVRQVQKRLADRVSHLFG